MEIAFRRRPVEVEAQEGDAGAEDGQNSDVEIINENENSEFVLFKQAIALFPVYSIVKLGSRVITFITPLVTISVARS